MCTYVKINQNGWFVAMLAIRWSSNDGETEFTNNLPIGDSHTWDLSKYGIALGTSCWAVADIAMGPNNHESGDNVTYDGDGTTAVYDLTGTTLMPSFSLE